jgi:hypothetical protein
MSELYDSRRSVAGPCAFIEHNLRSVENFQSEFFNCGHVFLLQLGGSSVTTNFFFISVAATFFFLEKVAAIRALFNVSR